MAIQHPLLRKALGLLGAVGSSLWRATIDWRAIYFDPTVDPVHPRHRGRYVYACWHEYLLMPIVLRGDRRMLALASRSGDGAIIAEAMHHLGWSLTRGSTSSGSVSALLNFLRADNRHPNVTPDGPRGPRRTMAMGPIFMAS
jgi:lysophospholipid acyltransferase (LPLAT)-like uncharacterized protein